MSVRQYSFQLIRDFSVFICIYVEEINFNTVEAENNGFLPATHKLIPHFRKKEKN